MENTTTLDASINTSEAPVIELATPTSAETLLNAFTSSTEQSLPEGTEVLGQPSIVQDATTGYISVTNQNDVNAPLANIPLATVRTDVQIDAAAKSMDVIMTQQQSQFKADIADGTVLKIVDLTPEVEDLKPETVTVTMTKTKSEDGKTNIVTMLKKKNKQHTDELVELDVSPLMDKFNGNKPKNKPKNINPNQQPHVKQQAVLLVPANRQATSYLQKAFSNNDFGEDGVDHINISSAATTELGKFLDIDNHFPFMHRELGNFASVGGFWFYVKGVEQDEIFRTVYGDRARFMGKKIETRNLVGFKTIIADATWMKIVSSERAVNEMVESILPFKNYYFQGALKIRKTTHDAIWYSHAIEEIRRTLKMRFSTGSKDLMPDFSFLEEKSNYMHLKQA